ncbi:MAG TPA: helix-turn-helix transcriptional regulator [Polyangia bacterium]|nr:helix-turn-helix transcriptional regulator [Polyangia bacterium]
MAGVDGVLTAIARVSYQAAEHGDLREVDRVMAELDAAEAASPPAGAEARAWRLALETIRWSFDPSRGRAPRPQTVRGKAVTPAASAALRRACAVMERAAFCTFDRKLLDEWIAAHAALDPQAKAVAPEPDLSLPAARLWARILHGDVAGLEGAAKSLAEEASRAGDAAALIEATIVRALALLSTGTLDDAVELGRRAARMAQAEALSHHEYLAHITLARVRRYTGRPHLALHILAALARVAPATWSGWIGWETYLSGGSLGDVVAPVAGPAMRAQQSLQALLDAARSGDRRAFDRAAADARSVASDAPVLADEVAAVIAAIDPLERSTPQALLPWLQGEIAAIPFGLHGVGVLEDAGPQAESATAFVMARPGQPGRRLLLPGLKLVPSARLLVRDTSRAGARTETGIAALALAGGAVISRDDFFRRVYGFPFVGYRHRAVLDTLCHRMRTLLGDAGEIRRDEGDGDENVAAGGRAPTIALLLHEPIVVPDMRCILPTADRVLRALALLGSTSASVAAEQLQMPLRTVQAVLQQLVSEGACTTERDGRHVVYRIEDTTFTQVTAA